MDQRLGRNPLDQRVLQIHHLVAVVVAVGVVQVVVGRVPFEKEEFAEKVQEKHFEEVQEEERVELLHRKYQSFWWEVRPRKVVVGPLMAQLPKHRVHPVEVEMQVVELELPEALEEKQLEEGVAAAVGFVEGQVELPIDWVEEVLLEHPTCWHKDWIAEPRERAFPFRCLKEVPQVRPSEEDNFPFPSAEVLRTFLRREVRHIPHT